MLRGKIVQVTNKRLPALDSLRFFAIAVIILSHLEYLKDTVIGDFYWIHLHNANWGVDFFFMLSGFGLYYSLSGKIFDCDVKNSVFFAIKKIKKIYPLYIFSLLICLPYNLIVPDMHIEAVIVRFVLNLTLLQSAFGMTALSHGINGVCWFLSTLFICYLFTPKLVVFIKNRCLTVKRTLSALFICFGLILALSAVFLYLQDILNEIVGRPYFNDFFYGSPYIRVFYVIFGMLLANLNLMLKVSETDLTFWECFCVIFIIAYFLFRNTLNVTPICLRSIDIFCAASILFLFSFEHGLISKNISDSQLLYSCGGGIVCTSSYYITQ